jgi:hypothetical protein
MLLQPRVYSSFRGKALDVLKYLDDRKEKATYPVFMYPLSQECLYPISS